MVSPFLFRLRSERRRPTLLVVYDREPLVGRFDPSLRVTLDPPAPVRGAYPALRAGASGGRVLRGATPHRAAGRSAGSTWRTASAPSCPGGSSSEVKFDRVFPSWFRAVIAEGGLRQQALSKYAMGLRHAARPRPWRFRGGTAVRALAASAR